MESNPFGISAEEYVEAFREIDSKMTANQRTILLTHYQTPGHSATARELGRQFGYKSNAPVNRQYGGLGKILCEALGVDTETFLNVLLGSDLNPRAEHKLTLWKEVVDAIRVLRWADRPAGPGGTVDADAGLTNGELEGELHELLTTERTRDAALRKRKVEQALALHAGRLRCEVPGCGFDFFAVYGEIGKGFIHVHHLRPLASRATAERTPLDELVLVCANCHAMIHVGGKCRSLHELIVRPGGAAAPRSQSE